MAIQRANRITQYLDRHSETFAKVGVISAVSVLIITVGRALLTTVVDGGYDLFTGQAGTVWRVFFYILMGSSVVCLGVSAALISASAILYSRRKLSAKKEQANG